LDESLIIVHTNSHNYVSSFPPLSVSIKGAFFPHNVPVSTIYSHHAGLILVAGYLLKKWSKVLA
jgi:hypothetical protein